MEAEANQGGIYIQADKLNSNDYLEFGLRIFLLIISLSLFVFLAYFFISRFVSAKILTSQKNILYVTPYKLTLLQGLGVVSEPELQLEVKTKTGYQKVNFLLDSGAVISSLPREMAQLMGYNLAFLPRTIFTGYGNKTSFAYRADMVLKIGRTNTSIPVVFTQAASTQPLIGRKGVFDQFAIIFDAKNKQIIIKNKG